VTVSAKNYNVKGENVGNYKIDEFSWIGEKGLFFEFSPSGAGKVCDPDSPPTSPSVTAVLHVYAEEDDSEISTTDLTSALVFSQQTATTINVAGDLCDVVLNSAPNSLALFYLDVASLVQSTF
jgi:hypothetical protein